jgi:hypothetical protein
MRAPPSATAAILAFLVLCVPALAATAIAAPPEGFSETHLAYVTGNGNSPEQVWAAGPGGAPPKLLGDGVQPLLAPDGKLVAAALGETSSGPALAVYSVAGAPTQTYANKASVFAVPLAWSPDSKYLAVATQSTALTNVAKQSSLAVIDVETATITTIAHGIVEGASFAPPGSDVAAPGSDMLAYGLASAFKEGAAVNIHISAPDGSGARLFTHDGRSLNPVWGPGGIAYDRERLRHLDFPVYQIWLAPSGGGAARQMTHVKVPALVSGLVPLAFSASGSKLLAEFGGQDTSAAWTVDVASGRARQLTAGEHTLMGAGISQDGTTVLVDEDALERPPSSARIATMPFDGGPLHVLVAHAAQASWNE